MLLSLCLGFPMWAMGRIQSGAERGPSLFWLPLLSCRLGPAAMSAFPTLHSGVHKPQSHIQARIGKSWPGTVASRRVTKAKRPACL